ncbi:dihydropteroate synthase [Thermoproteota archaeon]
MIPRVLSFNNEVDIIREMKDIKVDDYGIKIMTPKADSYVVKMDKVSSIAANILKQEMLSIGGDVAISRNSITGRDKHTGCLVIGNLTQLNRLAHKLEKQPFRLGEIGSTLQKSISDYSKVGSIVKCRNHTLRTGKKTLIMGIINVTSDSFSGDGLLKFGHATEQKAIVQMVLQKAERMVEEGVDIFDIGAESSRPGAAPISAKDEMMRLVPCVGALTKRFKVPVSVDTHKPQTVRAVLDAGASIINDITGLKDPKVKRLIASYRAGTIIMHMKGNPRTMQKNPTYTSLISDIISFLKNAIDSALDYGIPERNIIIDPGVGFGKTVSHNLELIRRLKEFKVLGRPILLGASRKSFIGKVLGVDVGERIFGSAAAVALSIKEGADIVRVHDIKQMRDVALLSDAIYRGNKE